MFYDILSTESDSSESRQQVRLSENGLGYSAPFPTDSHLFSNGRSRLWESGWVLWSLDAIDDRLGLCDGKAMMVDGWLTFWRNWRLMEGWFNIHLMWSNMIYINRCPPSCVEVCGRLVTWDCWKIGCPMVAHGWSKCSRDENCQCVAHFLRTPSFCKRCLQMQGSPRHESWLKCLIANFRETHRDVPSHCSALAIAFSGLWS